MLKVNTDKLNDIFAESLCDWATNTLAEAEADTVESIAYIIFIFSNRISDFPLGSKASNMEIAIASGVFTTHIDKINLPLIQKYPHYALLTLSIIAILIFIALGWLITKRK
ncbi:MAG: hypothetical protein V7K89_20050 [Nostoc sp.]|uniref:hypothetical protein n=1 Tax=Nostoc sp. TaxID=1180 RepID=UPI002FF64910